MLDPTHEEHDFLMEWYGKPFDPNDLKLDAVELKLARIWASRRKAAGRAEPNRLERHVSEGHPD